MNNACIDPEEIKKAISILKPNHELFEVRISDGNAITSGYFNDADTLIAKLSTLNLCGCNAYMTLHELHEGCAARIQWNTFLNANKRKLATTSDNDITAYRFIPVDLDPARPTDISSTDLELEEADEIKKEVIEYMTSQGFTSYIEALSGNGYHLLFPCYMRNTKEAEDTVKGYLKRLDELFSNDACHVDVKISNPSRVLKLYGTLAQKGRNTESRPYRMSRILKVVNGQNK